jgi:4'-phosphopantetheinyl transferase
MIDWLVQTADDAPGLAHGLAPEGWLNPTEQARFRALRHAKRRSDWLLGRWTAKRLLQAYVAARTGEPPPLDRIEIANGLDGAPGVILPSGGWTPGLDRAPSPSDHLTLSISHSHDRAFCVLSRMPGIRIGADIELVEPRSPVFAADYFAAAEVVQVEQIPPGSSRDTLQTAIWSAKEAALKALHLGLTVDTRRVVCDFASFDIEKAAAGWELFWVEIDAALLQTGAPEIGMAARTSGWWRILDRFVLTLVTIQSE